jgi:hypothetical protein
MVELDVYINNVKELIHCIGRMHNFYSNLKG